jgi:hypothetical protein
MRWYLRIILGGLFVAVTPIASMAQNDICASGRIEQSDQARAEQLRIQAGERAARLSWDIKMIPVKNPINERNNNFNALCIFRIEVVLQPVLKVVQVRAPKELMAAIEEAIKTIDVPPPPPAPVNPPYVQKSVEITAYVLVAAERAVDPSWMPIPQALASVANQLKAILPNETLFLADTVVARGTENGKLGVSGGTSFEGTLTIRDGGAAGQVVRLGGLNVSSNGSGFNTSIDIPVGTQVVVGKASSTLAPRKAVVLVITAKLLN